MSERLERALTVILVCAAVVIAVSVAHREFLAKAPIGQQPEATIAPTFMASWTQALSIGKVFGDTNTAAMKVVVLSDLECPFCRSFHKDMKELMHANGRDVAMVFVHFPLPMHRFARLAARAAECAGATGKFQAFVDEIFLKQDSLGLKSWGSYASEAGISDTAGIARCAAKSNSIAPIDQGMAFAKQIGATATPTVIVNGWRFPHPPSIVELENMLDSLKRHAPRASVTGGSRQ